MNSSETEQSKNNTEDEDAKFLEFLQGQLQDVSNDPMVALDLMDTISEGLDLSALEKSFNTPEFKSSFAESAHNLMQDKDASSVINAIQAQIEKDRGDDKSELGALDMVLSTVDVLGGMNKAELENLAKVVKRNTKNDVLNKMRSSITPEMMARLKSKVKKKK
jgi:hypothetical protein